MISLVFVCLFVFIYLLNNQIELALFTLNFNDTQEIYFLTIKVYLRILNNHAFFATSRWTTNLIAITMVIT